MLFIYIYLPYKIKFRKYFSPLHMTLKEHFDSFRLSSLSLQSYGTLIFYKIISILEKIILKLIKICFWHKSFVWTDQGHSRMYDLVSRTYELVFCTHNLVSRTYKWMYELVPHTWTTYLKGNSLGSRFRTDFFQIWKNIIKNEPRRKQNMSVIVLPKDFLSSLRHFI